MFRNLRENFIELLRPLPYPEKAMDMTPRSPFDPLDPDELVYVPEGAPAYSIEPWNKLKDEFNCYSYALRLLEHGWATPGHLVSRRIDPSPVSQTLLDTWLQRDGLERVLHHEGNCLKDHILAAFVSPVRLNPEKIDYHFYSLDRDGTWSHKLGDKPVTKHDSNMHIIHDPLQAGRRHGSYNYSKFVGFYRVPANGIVYQAGGPLSHLHG